MTGGNFGIESQGKSGRRQRAPHRTYNIGEKMRVMDSRYFL